MPERIICGGRRCPNGGFYSDDADAGDDAVERDDGARVDFIERELRQISRWFYSGTSGSDTYSVSLLANGTTEQIVQSSPAIPYTIAKSALGSTPIKINPGTSDDSLTVSYVNGNPVPTGGLFYDARGGERHADDQLGSSGPDSVTLANAFSGPTAGNIDINDPSTRDADRRRCDVQRRRGE